jgi:hypothetical protein
LLVKAKCVLMENKGLVSSDTEPAKLNGQLGNV